MTVQPTSSYLPLPDAAALAQSDVLYARIVERLQQQGGWIAFADYMQMALYTPHLGYYSSHANKFGTGGDFVTAPEISPLFAQSMSMQVQQVLAQTQGSVLELGAGTGKLALGLLTHLQAIEQLPEQYLILELSADLRDRQQQLLQAALPAATFARVQWLDQLPQHFTGVVIGNEVLDAIPVHVLTWQGGVWLERGVAFDQTLHWQLQPLTDPTLVATIPTQHLPEGYTTEVCPAARGLIASLATMLQQGLILLPDYGFPAREYYHPQRTQGTLMCHFQHHAHDNPLIYPGLQDITAHVDFTAMAETGLQHGLTCAGYASQASFLINCGILQHMQQVPVEDSVRYLSMSSAVQKLLSPAEMGELFKVLALSKGMAFPLIGFVQGDKRHQL